MDKATVTIFDDGRAVVIAPEVAKELGLRHGQRVDSKTALRAGQLNVEFRKGEIVSLKKKEVVTKYDLD